ncbi:helix-turn-helix domain-containing protein [Saccharopolyspora pogona]|uniref:helix-turn-helix domain-containing protein n=1 Tax=Saccharopolyspora pogona TaxID=333966 RepID=UPI0016838DF9|nr:helix-turn-helix domain-containing protein [Saccharopolyspora pogona]
MSEKQQGETPGSWEEQVAGLEELLTAKEAAIVLRMHPVTVRRLAAEGDIPGTKIGNEWRFRKSALLKLLQVELDTPPEASQE